MKYKNSILICEMDTGQLNLYVRGVFVGEINNLDFKETTPPERIANNDLTYFDILDRLYEVSGAIRNKIDPGM